VSLTKILQKKIVQDIDHDNTKYIS